MASSVAREVTVRDQGEAPASGRGRNKAALRDAMAALAPELFGRALRLSRSPSAAEDLVQDTIERAIRFEEHWTPGTNLRAWVHQILFSVFVTRCRKQRRERHAMEHLSTDPCAWTAHEVVEEACGLSPGMQRALGTLPKAFRDVVVYVDLEEMSYKDAAKRLGVPVGTVMSRLFRGRRQLASALGAREAIAA